MSKMDPSDVLPKDKRSKPPRRDASRQGREHICLKGEEEGRDISESFSHVIDQIRNSRTLNFTEGLYIHMFLESSEYFLN